MLSSTHQLRLAAPVLFLFLFTAHAFPGGAPAGVCHKDPAKAVREPHHGKAKAQPIESVPYTILAETDRYAAGQTVRISISGIEAFRGFIVQAHDSQTDQPVGGFLASPNTTLLSDCATITHADAADKRYAFLLWQAPEQRDGGVFFT